MGSRIESDPKAGDARNPDFKISPLQRNL